MTQTINIAHIAIWTADIERSKEFYETYFGGTASEKYENKTTNFQSYFVNFGNGAMLEIMQKESINKISQIRPAVGMAHLAFNVGSKKNVDKLTMTIQRAGYEIIGKPRVTGDGYYESIIADPDGNLIEIVG